MPPTTRTASGKYAGKLNDAMRESLIEMLNAGDSNRRILARISAERRAGVLYEGLAWPEFNSGDAAYYRSVYADDGAIQRGQIFSAARETGLARRQQYTKRIIEQIDAIEALIDANNAVIMQYINQGVLDGVPYEMVETPDILDADFTVDGGIPGSKLPAKRSSHSRVTINIDPNEDPRYKRIMDLQFINSKHYGNLVAFMKQLALVGGLASEQKLNDEHSQTQQERIDKVRETLTRFGELTARRARAASL